MKEFKKIKNFIFDCDGVLYDDLEGVFGQVSKRMTEYISKKLNLSHEKAKELQTSAKPRIGTPKHITNLNPSKEKILSANRSEI